jgi:hypothetical protein
VATQCHYLIPGVDVVEVGGYRTTNDESHFNLPAYKHISTLLHVRPVPAVFPRKRWSLEAGQFSHLSKYMEEGTS